MDLKGQGERKRDSIGEKGYFSKHSSSPPDVVGLVVVRRLQYVLKGPFPSSISPT